MAKKNKKSHINFACYPYRFDDIGLTTLFLFYPGGVWDEDKLMLKEALEKYPIDKFEWVFFGD